MCGITESQRAAIAALNAARDAAIEQYSGPTPGEQAAIALDTAFGPGFSDLPSIKAVIAAEKNYAAAMLERVRVTAGVLSAFIEFGYVDLDSIDGDLVVALNATEAAEQALGAAGAVFGAEVEAKQAAAHGVTLQ